LWRNYDNVFVIKGSETIDPASPQVARGLHRL
jgi:hypothetical protein